MSALGHYSHRATARVVDFNDYLTAGAIQRSPVSFPRNSPSTPNVRNGLKADIAAAPEFVCFVPIADLADRHRVRKLRTAIKDPLRDALRLVLAAELPPMGSARAQLIDRDR
jgi:hypothetical protein